MFEQLFQRLGHRYITAMLLATRLSGSIGGVAVVYYVNLTVTFPEPTLSRFITACAVVVVLAVVLSLICARWETRHLQRVLRLLEKGAQPPQELAAKAGREAVIFPVRHHRHEAWLVPCTTLLPVLVLLKYGEDASSEVLLNVTLAVFMGIGLALMSTFLIIERVMEPVVRHLLTSGIVIDFEQLPANKLRSRLNLCFGLTILITALMIGTLASQRAADIIEKDNEQQQEAVVNLRNHTVYITLAAIVVGLFFSTTISQSVASRVGRLVQAMKRVEAGNFNQELRATGNDEIDVLTRQFNSMVLQLAQHDGTIRDLNMNLERKVEERTLSLRLLHAELDQRNNEVESAMQDLKDAQSQLVDVAHRAGMTEIATGVLHNVGNVLNSVNVSVSVLHEDMRKSRTSNIARVAALIKEHNELFASHRDPKVQQVPQYLSLLAESVAAERRRTGEELANLTEKVEHIKNIINAQQNYTRRVAFKETIDLRRVIEDLLSMHAPGIAKHSISVACDFGELPAITVEKTKLLQVLDNLVKNAIEAMSVTDRPEHQLRIRTWLEGGVAMASVTDTGHGISDEQLQKIFRFGFTTKVNGNGFGLHSSALAMSEMGGGIHVASDGNGATFTISLPIKSKSEEPAAERLVLQEA
jgi:two-component system, NtrC family, sensor kinase